MPLSKGGHSREGRRTGGSRGYLWKYNVEVFMFLLSIIFDTSGFYGSYKEMRSSHSRRKRRETNISILIRKPNWVKNMQFVAYLFGQKKDTILIAFNVNQWDLYSSIADYLNKMHINISCHTKHIMQCKSKFYKSPIYRIWCILTLFF